jgi:hypothetical protein
MRTPPRRRSTTGGWLAALIEEQRRRPGARVELLGALEGCVRWHTPTCLNARDRSALTALLVRWMIQAEEGCI